MTHRGRTSGARSRARSEPRTATVIGSGPNGLAAAVTLARAGFQVRVWEAAPTLGGGVRTGELTLPGFRHDLGSAVHPAALTSPFFRAFGLEQRVEWIVPEASYAHPLDGGRAAIAWRDLERTAEGLGQDAKNWRAMIRPLTRNLNELVGLLSDQLIRMPADPVIAARFGMRVAQLGTRLHGISFTGEDAAALLAGVCAHANTPLPSPAAAAAGLLLAAHGHAQHGWPLPRGGAQSIADALVDDLIAHGGTVETDCHVHTLAGLDWGDPEAGDILILDTAPELLLTAEHLPDTYARALRRYRRGPGVAKVDFALSEPIPWTHADIGMSPTVHLGGSYAEISASENTIAQGREAEHPFVILVQPTVLDASRAPEGNHTAWAYMHTPRGSSRAATGPVIAQIERFAPGFRDLILAHSAMPAADRHLGNPAEIGGDILGGALSLRQAITRPTLSRAPWRTPLRGMYLCSAATPPGPGVTGMPGWHAAQCAMQDVVGMRLSLEILAK